MEKWIEEIKEANKGIGSDYSLEEHSSDRPSDSQVRRGCRWCGGAPSLTMHVAFYLNRLQDSSSEADSAKEASSDNQGASEPEA